MTISHSNGTIETKLNALHQQLVEESGKQHGDIEHRASFGDWSIVLRGAGDDTLEQVTLTRCGQESYGFVRSEDGIFEPDGPTKVKTKFADAHLHTLGGIATREDLDWTTTPSAN